MAAVELWAAEVRHTTVGETGTAAVVLLTRDTRTVCQKWRRIANKWSRFIMLSKQSPEACCDREQLHHQVHAPRDNSALARARTGVRAGRPECVLKIGLIEQRCFTFHC